MSLHGRLLHAALPLVKLRTRLRGLTLGVCAGLFDGQGRVMLVRHSYSPGWRFPGGGAEFGETVQAALSRELREEVGVTLDEPPVLKGLFHNPEWTAGDHVAYFEAGGWSSSGWAPSLEIEACETFDPHDLPDDVHPSVVRRLRERTTGDVSQLW